MNALKFPIVKLTVFLIIGILLAHYFDISLIQSIVLLAGTLVICISTLLYSRKQIFKTIWFGLASFALMTSLGILSYNFHDHFNHRNHYTKTDLDWKMHQNFQLLVVERLRPSSFYDRYVVKIETLGAKNVTGKTILQIEKMSHDSSLVIGDVVQCFAKLENIPRSKNPYQFNYKKYLNTLNIYHLIQCQPSQIITIGHRNSLYSYSDRLRLKINEELKKQNLQNEELAIINALLLGQRQDLKRSTYQNYVNAGAIHILAVSGLHVGIILMLLNFIFKPVSFLKHGKVIKVVLLLISLWSFAIIAGLSASVTRAVTMFSIVAIAMHLKRPTNIYNTLCISAFFILLIKPKFLLQVGFQLSYIAVIAIVSIQPLLYKLWQTKYKLFDYLWQTLTVTISAQIGVAPIGLFYFHQFPGLFFLSNLVIIPFLGIILSYGLIVILSASFGILTPLVAEGFGTIISLMNSFVSWISNQDDFLITNITFDIWHLIGYYLLIIAVFQVFKNSRFTSVRLALVSIIILQLIWITRKQKFSTDMLVIFQKNRNTIIGIKQNFDLKIGHSTDSSIYEEPLLKDFIRENSIKNVAYDSVSSIYGLHDLKLLVIDQSGIYNLNSFSPNHVLLRNSPKINLNRLIDHIKPKLIIADGSNYRSYVERWKATCKNKKIPFHSTYEKGAFTYNSN